nr:hypothetical protein [Candidatus Enterousia merdequi]
MHLFKRHSKDYKIVAKSKYFDKKWYLITYPDVAKTKMDPVKHYLEYGWKEGRNPSEKFNTNAYLSSNIDVKDSNMNPLLHYEKYGKKEGRFVDTIKGFEQIIIPQKHKNKIGVIYTCITGEYDNLIQHKCVNNNFDYVCFTDNKKLLQSGIVNGWVIKKLKYNKSDDIRNARWHKIHPEKLFSQYDYSIWIDGNLNILNDS